MNSSVSHTGRFEALDGMRGLCAVIVALMHFDLVLGTGAVFRHGWLSVDMFFVLSGFVIALRYEDGLSSPGGFLAFARARAARLLPVQFLGTAAVALSFLLLFLTGHLDFPGVTMAALVTAFLFGLLLIPMTGSPIGSLFPRLPHGFAINTPLWSLQAEWIVNLIYARWFSAVSTRRLLVLWAVLAFGLVLYVFEGRQQWDHTLPPADMLAGLARAAIGFPAGALLCRLHRQGLLAVLPCVNPRMIFAVWLLVCLVPMGGPMPIFESAVAVILAPLSAALLIRGERPLPALYAMLGKLSYPLYASHFAVVNLATIWFVQPSGRNLPYIFPMLALALLLAAAIERLAAAAIRFRRLSFLRSDVAAAPSP